MKRDPENTIRILLAGASRLAGHREARAAWVKATAAAWREAQRQMDERCDAAVTRLSEEEFERLCDEEEAKVDAFRAPLTAVAERDAWPREMHWGGI
jgi:hypothetical protein